MTGKNQGNKVDVLSFILQSYCVAYQINHPTHTLQVDADDFAALEDCILNGDFGICETVPAGDPAGRLVNPTAAFAIDISGPAL